MSIMLISGTKREKVHVIQENAVIFFPLVTRKEITFAMGNLRQNWDLNYIVVLDNEIINFPFLDEIFLKTSYMQWYIAYLKH